MPICSIPIWTRLAMLWTRPTGKVCPNGIQGGSGGYKKSTDRGCLAAQIRQKIWRWRRDLNPRTVFAVTRFRGVLLRPLGHATVEQLTEPAAPHPNRWRAKNASSGAAHS